MIESHILTKKALKIISKKIRNEKLTQQDSNYISRFVRPKLRSIVSLDATNLLNQLEYSPKARAIENKIKKIITNHIPHPATIIVCGSAIQTNYKEYGDIDIIVATKKVLIKSLKEKNKLIEKIKEEAKKYGLNLDMQIYSKEAIISQYPYSPSLIYQLKDSKVIYGNIKIPNRTKLSPIDLKMKLDWSELQSNPRGKEIYLAIRNAILVSLLLNKKIDNYQLNQNISNILGQNLVNKLKSNQASKIEKKLALSYLGMLIKYLESELNNSKWEKIEIYSNGNIEKIENTIYPEDKMENLKKIIVNVLKKYNIARAGIFGSYARGEQKKNSDIDILIGFNGSLLNIAKIENELKDALGKKVDLLTYKSINPLLKKRILNEEVKII